jgi:hypothetical protein
MPYAHNFLAQITYLYYHHLEGFVCVLKGPWFVAICRPFGTPCMICRGCQFRVQSLRYFFTVFGGECSCPGCSMPPVSLPLLSLCFTTPESLGWFAGYINFVCTELQLTFYRFVGTVLLHRQWSPLGLHLLQMRMGLFYRNPLALFFFYFRLTFP